MNKVYPLFFNPDEVVEIRALGLRGKSTAWEGFAGGKGGIVSGYFDDPVKFAASAAALDKALARGVYFTINPCNPVLLSRAVNRLICPQKENSTPDQYMSVRRWFLIDLDAKMLDGNRRPPDVSASIEELEICKARAAEVAKYLEEEHGFSRAIRAFSGNGFHLNYRLPDLPNDDESKELIVNATAALAEKFGKEDIDVSVTNAGRIWKFYGTTGRKGDSTPERQHRKSYIFPGQPETLADVPVTSLEVLKKYAALASAQAPPAPRSTPVALPPPEGRPAAPSSSSGKTRPIKKSELGPIDMEKYLRHFGVSYDVKEMDDSKRGAATQYRLDKCVFNPDHGPNEASIMVPRVGAILYQCFHASCKSQQWKDARRKISGDKSLAEFCQGFDPNWQPPRATGTGMLDELTIPMVHATSLQNGIGSPQKVDPPTAIDPAEFYDKKGKRPVFVPWKLALYLSHYLYPLCNTAGIYYHYEGGVWKVYTKSQIAQIIVHAMKKEIQAAWVNNVIETILAGMVNREEVEWPNNPMMINVKNGMINLETRELLPHDPSYGSRSQLPVNYNPTADNSKRWDKFLAEIFDYVDDDIKRTPEEERTRTANFIEKYTLLQQFYGYCLLRDCRYQKALFLYGTGANGKSTALDVLAAMVGPENTSSLTLQDLSKQFRGNFLQNKLVNISTEADTRDPLSTSILKSVIAGDPFTTERKYGEPFQYRPYAKWLVALNEALVIPDKSYGLSRRLIVLNFEHRFEPAEIKVGMSQYLIEDVDLIFKWSLDGLTNLLKAGGFIVGEKVQEDTDKLMEAMNPLLIFVGECCEIYDGVSEQTNRLWSAYNAWCADGRNRPLGRNKFYEQLLATFTTVKKKRVEVDEEDGAHAQETRFLNIHLTSAGRGYAEKGQRRTDRMFE